MLLAHMQQKKNKRQTINNSHVKEIYVCFNLFSKNMLVQKKIINRLSALVLSIAGASILLGCGSQEETGTEKPTSTESIETEKQTGNSSHHIDQDNSETKLAIDSHRCIGCGKCARVAPENFKMSGRKAVIVSEKESGATTQAIKICPVDAISA